MAASKRSPANRKAKAAAQRGSPRRTRPERKTGPIGKKSSSAYSKAKKKSRRPKY